ncbi:hypothetical protein C1H46_005077 [Malus baccata]|uniref:Uncharacterized protein n=1 Tax=Malus baccata TaxID=106549 RepID=A0A540NE87_MALBA|nr:hypothetical protein C1H46_005077 [Malus baccata]
MWKPTHIPFQSLGQPHPKSLIFFLWKPWEQLYTCPLTGRDSPPPSFSCCHGCIWKEEDGLKAGLTRLVRGGEVGRVDREGWSKETWMLLPEERSRSRRRRRRRAKVSERE